MTNYKTRKDSTKGSLSVRRKLKVPRYSNISRDNQNSRNKRGDIAFDNATSKLFLNNGREWSPIVNQFNVFPNRLFIFGASLEDTGNMNILDMKVAPNAIDAGICEEIGPKGRFSNGFVYTDYLVNALNKKMLNSLASFQTVGQQQCLNYSIGGAIYDGNVNNEELGLPDLGQNGYVSQVDLFEQDLTKYNLNVSENDVFVYGSVGGNDLGVIALGLATPANYIDAHFDNIQRLYARGCRQLIFIYVDADSIPNIPAFIKTDLSTSTPITIADLQNLSNTINNPLIDLLNDAINGGSATMPNLNLTILPASDLLNEFISRPSVYGIRKPLEGDVDPRGTSASLPFPTYCGSRQGFPEGTRNTTIKGINYLFYDDLHFTDVTNKKISDFVLSHLQNYTNVPQERRF